MNKTLKTVLYTTGAILTIATGYQSSNYFSKSSKEFNLPIRIECRTLHSRLGSLDAKMNTLIYSSDFLTKNKHNQDLLRMAEEKRDIHSSIDSLEKSTLYQTSLRNHHDLDDKSLYWGLASMFFLALTIISPSDKLAGKLAKYTGEKLRPRRKEKTLSGSD